MVSHAFVRSWLSALYWELLSRVAVGADHPLLKSVSGCRPPGPGIKLGYGQIMRVVSCIFSAERNYLFQELEIKKTCQIKMIAIITMEIIIIIFLFFIGH